jgi:hypothetical protein
MYSPAGSAGSVDPKTEDSAVVLLQNSNVQSDGIISETTAPHNNRYYSAIVTCCRIITYFQHLWFL